MDRIRILIVDDEPLARERLRDLLRAEPAVELVGECADGTAAVAAIRRLLPDLVFLDMQLPGCDGLQVIAQLAGVRWPAIIFATAHERFAVEAFNVEAADYLLKPFDRERLQQALRRAREQLRARAADGPGPAAETPVAGPRLDRIAFKSEGRMVFFRPGEIVWVEADDNYVILHLSAGRLMVRETLAAIEERLGAAGFTRINRSALVQLDQIRELHPAVHGDYTVVLRDGTRLPLSRSLRGRLDQFAGDKA